MLLVINIYDYARIILKVLCKNVNYKTNIIRQIYHLTIMNVFFILCSVHRVEDRMRKNTKSKIINGAIGHMNGWAAGKTTMMYKLKLVEVVTTIVKL